MIYIIGPDSMEFRVILLYPRIAFWIITFEAVTLAVKFISPTQPLRFAFRSARPTAATRSGQATFPSALCFCGYLGDLFSCFFSSLFLSLRPWELKRTVFSCFQTYWLVLYWSTFLLRILPPFMYLPRITHVIRDRIWFRKVNSSYVAFGLTSIIVFARLGGLLAFMINPQFSCIRYCGGHSAV